MGKNRMRRLTSALVSITTSLLIIHAYMSQHEDILELTKSQFVKAVVPSRGVTNVLHLLIVANRPDVNLCRTILTAHLLGYPTPTLLSWNQTSDEHDLGRTTTDASQYRQSIAKNTTNDLVIVVEDVWFQLPPKVLFERYRSITHDANQALLQRLGPATVSTFNLSQEIVFGASKRCTPNKPYSVACYAVPESPLPKDLYGNNTDTVVGYSVWSSLRQRYLDSGMALGPVDSMQLAFDQAARKLTAMAGKGHEAWGGHVHDQAIWNMVFGEQEFQREVLRRQHLTPAALKREQRLQQPSRMEGTVIDDPIDPSFWHETMEHGSGREYECGIGLDYWSRLTQQTSNANLDIKSLYYNESSSIVEQIGSRSAFTCPSRVNGHLPDDILNAGLHETRIPSEKESSWSDIPLLTNLCLDTIPVAIHHDGAKDTTEHMWEELWINRLPAKLSRDGILRYPNRTFAVADGRALTWRELCPAEQDAEVFGGASEAAQAARCSPNDTFVLGEGTEHVEHGKDGSLWPYQIFKSSPVRPPVMNIKQASDATLAPGLLFITLYHTEEQAKIKMPGPMIFTDQGRLIWFGPVGNTANFRWQLYDGRPTLLFWIRDGPGVRGHGYGNITFLESDYSVKTVLCPQYSLNTARYSKPHCEADLHEAHVVSSRNTIITTAYNTTPADLSSVHGPVAGWIWDSQFNEIDPISKSVLFHWRASDHIPLTESRKVIRDQGSFARPYDFFHINSVVDIGDHYLLSSRHCWTVYLIDKQGHIVWRLTGDGKGSDFGELPPEAQFRWQHDARPHNVGHDHIDLSLFDNQNWDANQKEAKRPAKLLVFRLPVRPIRGANESQVEVINILRPETDYQSVSQGAFDNNLPNGNKLASWGNIPILTEFDNTGKEIWSAEFGRAGEVHIYRGFKQEWHATPYTRPDLFVEKNAERFRGYVSWNGATDVEGWNVYAGLSTDSVKHLGSVRNRGFETEFDLPCWTRFAQVGAIEQGREVRRSKFFQVA